MKCDYGIVIPNMDEQRCDDVNAKISKYSKVYG